jgi:asparagine synthase (glutamine-hydrolysing)
MPTRRSDADLIEEFRSQFHHAVRATLGGETRVAAHLSGGLDSTSVVGTATGFGVTVDSYSLVYPTMPVAIDGEMLDETPFVDAAVRATGVRSVRFDPLGPGGIGRDDFLRVLTAHGELPDAPTSDALTFPLFARAAADGHRVLLTGIGGDMWLTGSVSRLPWLIKRGRLVEAIRFVRAARDAQALDASWALIRAHLRVRFTPEWIKRGFRRLRTPRPWPRWLRQEFTDRVDLGARLGRLSAGVPRVDDDVLQHSLLRLSLSESVLSRESLFRGAADAGLDVRHPMLHRPFVEFVMTLPDDLRMRDGGTRYILRRALARELPDVIRTRHSKGDATTIIGVAIAQVLRGGPLRGGTARRGWIDPAMVAPLIASVAAQSLTRRPDGADELLWALVAVDEWLESAGA